MPRQSRGPAAAPRRPTAAPARAPAPQQQQTRPASTAAYPGQRQSPPVAAPQQSAGSGLFGQMASTAAGVAVGSSIGHAIGGFFGGGSSAPAAEQQQQPLAQGDNGAYMANSNSGFAQQAQGACATDVNNFRQCMDQNNGELTICGWYLDQLKACQAAARPY